MQKGLKIRDNVEEAVVSVEEKLVEVTSTFYDSNSSLLAAHLE